MCFSNNEDYADKCLNYDNLLIQYSDYSYEANKILHTIKNHYIKKKEFSLQ